MAESRPQDKRVEEDSSESVVSSAVGLQPIGTVEEQKRLADQIYYNAFTKVADVLDEWFEYARALEIQVDIFEQGGPKRSTLHYVPALFLEREYTPENPKDALSSQKGRTSTLIFSPFGLQSGRTGYHTPDYCVVTTDLLELSEADAFGTEVDGLREDDESPGRFKWSMTEAFKVYPSGTIVSTGQITEILDATTRHLAGVAGTEALGVFMIPKIQDRKVNVFSYHDPELFRGDYMGETDIYNVIGSTVINPLLLRMTQLDRLNRAFSGFSKVDILLPFVRTP